MDYQTIQITEPDEGIRLLALHRPEKRNAISARMRREVSAALAALAEDDAVRVVIFTGSGHSFSSGFDLNEFKREDLAEELALSSIAYHRDVWQFPKPTIAAINGFCMGGGLDLAVLCDVRLCAENALFAHPQVRFGGIPLYSALRWIVGAGLARDLCLTGRHIDAREAHRAGLVSEVLPPEALQERALEFAQMMVQCPPQAHRTLKQHFLDSEGAGFEATYRAEHEERFRRRFLDD